MSAFLSNPVILSLSVIAIILTVSARFVGHKYVSAGLSISGFVLVIACIIYALLLGVELEDVLVFVLVFTLISVTAFLPTDRNGTKKKSNIDKDKISDDISESIEPSDNETEGKQ